MPAYNEANSRPRRYWKVKEGEFEYKNPDSGEITTANRIEGSLRNVYIHDDPGSPRHKIAPSKKVVVTLADEGDDAELNKIVFNPETHFAWSLVSRLTNVAPDTRIKIGSRPGKLNPKVSFATVLIFNPDAQEWEKVDHLDVNPEDAPQRQKMVLDLVENHPANRKPEANGGNQGPQGTSKMATATSKSSAPAAGAESSLDALAELAED